MFGIGVEVDVGCGCGGGGGVGADAMWQPNWEGFLAFLCLALMLTSGIWRW